jgi:hypothetical protein
LPTQTLLTLNNLLLFLGTWSKKSTFVSGRKPYNQDTTALDYEVDSEAEWEEDEPGEELNSEDEDEDDGMDAMDAEEEELVFICH